MPAMEHRYEPAAVSAAVSPSSLASSPSAEFYENTNPRNWTVSVISRGLMVEQAYCKEIRAVLKKEIERRHIVGTSLGTPENQAKLGEALQQLETAFPSVFTPRIPQPWLESCKLGMARKINNTYNHYRNRRRRAVPSLSTDSALCIARPLTFGETGFPIRSTKTTADTLFFASDIIKEKKPLASITSDEIEFEMFKEVLREDGVYNGSTDRILCRIGKNDVEVYHARKFKAAALQMYNRGENPISFHIEARQRGTYLVLCFDCAPTDCTPVKRRARVKY